MMTESEIQQLIMIKAPEFGCILMRNNSGALKDKDGRIVRFGLGNQTKAGNEKIKSSDLIGITTIDGAGIFTAIEVKASGWKYTGTKREQAQENFLKWVRMRGGIGFFCSSVDEFVERMKR